MDSSQPAEAVPPQGQESGVLGSLLSTSGGLKSPPSTTNVTHPTPSTPLPQSPVTPVIVTASTLLQTTTGVRASPPHTSTPLIFGLISGTDTKATLGMSSVKSPKTVDTLASSGSGGTGTKLVSAPQDSGGHGSGKPKAFLSMLGEGARTPPSTGASRKQTSGSKRVGGQSVKATSGQSAKATPGHSAKSTPGHSAKSTPGHSAKSTSGHSAKFTPGATPSSSKDSAPRSSQRAIKRPRYYDDDDSVDFEPMKNVSKKHKAGPRGASKATAKKPNLPAKVPTMTLTKDLSRWRPTDDLMLISAVQQTNDLAAVYLGIKFSCRFTLREIEERWYALLYDHQISHRAVEAMRGLHPGVVTMALNNALWSQEEEAVLAKIPSSDAGHLETFQGVLRDHPAVFHTCRTATSLHHHWVLMGHYNLLNDQKVQLIPPGDNVTDFTDAEDQKSDTELVKPRDVREEALEQELIANDRQNKREIMRLEEDLPLWRTVLDTGAAPDFQDDELAVFRGKVVEFRMKKKSVTFGRATPTNKVDFDLSLEGPAYKISRRQASVHHSEEGEWVLHNEGRRVLFVDGRAVPSGRSARLESNQTIEVASMSFLVLLNSTAGKPNTSS